MTALVRLAVPADAAAISAVRVASWREAYRGIVDAAYLAALDPDDGRRKAEQRFAHPAYGVERFTLVAEAGGTVVGFVHGGPAREASPPGFDGELYAIYLLPAHQGAGHGRRLFEAFAARMATAGYRSLLLWTLADNAPARAFYERLGGRPSGHKTLAIGAQVLDEVAYGWDPLPGITAPGASREPPS